MTAAPIGSLLRSHLNSALLFVVVLLLVASQPPRTIQNSHYELNGKQSFVQFAERKCECFGGREDPERARREYGTGGIRSILAAGRLLLSCWRTFRVQMVRSHFDPKRTSQLIKRPDSRMKNGRGVIPAFRSNSYRVRILIFGENSRAGHGPSLSLDPSADGVSYALVLHGSEPGPQSRAEQIPLLREALAI